MMLTTYTPTGHLVGMLDRDQRTAKIFIKPEAEYEESETVSASSGDAVTSTETRRLLHRNRKSFVWRTMQRLKQVLVVGTYLLSIVSIPGSQSAPTNRAAAMEEERLNSKPKWINPCGIKRDQDQQDSYTEVPQVSEKDLLTQIISQANIALTNAKQFKDEFAMKTFNLDTDSLHTQWQANHYDWLPLMMDLEQVPELNNGLIDIYEHLQKFAVGLEQIVWDQEDNRGAFLKNFTDTEYNLRSLLCEIQMAIIELGLTQKPDIDRNLMGSDFRSITDATERNLRDWLIYRDYMSALEYTVQAFGNLYATF